MSQPIVINKDDLASLLKDIVPQQAPRLPRYFLFPDDIITMLCNKPKESTVRGWKTYYGLPTTKIGAVTYVKEEDWQWWEANNRKIMAKAGRTRGERLGGKDAKQ